MPAEQLTITSPSKNESNSNQTDFEFKLQNPSTTGYYIELSLADGTALAADNDYGTTIFNGDGRFYINPNGDSRTFTIKVNGDTKPEADETFSLVVNVYDSQTATTPIRTFSGLGTILNDDGPATTMTLTGPGMLNEGSNGGTTSFDFVVRRSVTSGTSPTATYTITDGTGINAGEYGPGLMRTGTVTFAAGSDTATISVPVARDNVVEGDDQFTLTLSDPQNATISGSPSATATIVNDDFAPVANPDSYSILEDTPYTFNPLANDTDQNNDTLTLVSYTQPAHGTVTLSNGSLTYTPAADYNGPDSLTYRVSDGANQSTGTVSINVQAVNDAPAGADKTISGTEDTAITLTGADFGFTDVDGNALSAVRFGTLPNGMLTYGGTQVIAGPQYDLSQGQTFQFTPAANINGNAVTSLTFQVADNGGTTNGGVNQDPTPNTLTFNLAAVNDAPVNTVPGAQTANEDTAKTITGISVADVDNTNVSVTLSAAHGTINGAGTYIFIGSAAAINSALASITYRGNPNYNGPDTITVTTTDGAGGTDTDTIAVTVNSVNDAPAGTDKTIAGTEDTAITLTGADFGFTDVDGNMLSAVRFNTLPNGSLLTSGGVQVTAGEQYDLSQGRTFQFTPAANISGNAATSLTFQVADNGGIDNGGVNQDPTPNTLTFNLAPVNDTPTIASGGTLAGTVTEDAATTPSTTDSTTASVSVKFSDPDTTDTHTATAVLKSTTATGGMALGSLSTPTVTESGGSGSANATYTLDNSKANYLGATDTVTEVYTVTIRDSANTSTTQDVTITIQGTNDAPIAGADTNAVNEDATVMRTDRATGLLGNDTDPDAGQTATLVVSGAHAGTAAGGDTAVTSAGTSIAGTYGTLQLKADGTYSYSANTDAARAIGAGESRNDVFTYTARDTSGTANATATAQLTITVNGTTDAPYSITNSNVGEGNSGTTPLNFTITRSPSTLPATVYVRPTSGSATAGSDFNGATIPVTFAANATTATFAVPITGDTVVEPNEQFTVTVYQDAALTVPVASSVGTIVNDDSPASQVEGTNGNDLLYATGNGPSTLIGFDGNDTYVVRNINDVIREFDGGGNDIVYSSISYTLNADAQVENLVTQTNADTTALNLIGNGFNQYVVGNFGNNVLNGNGGIDTLVGLKGDDIYSVGDARAVVLENGGEGNDTVYATVSYRLAAGQEIETLSTQTQSDTTALNMIGNEFGQKVIGNNGANLLDGGAGADTLIGLGGADTFSFSTALGNGNVDTIQDYQAGTDHIQLLSSVFTGLSAGTLASGAFVNGTTATAASAQVLYNQATGQLYFDADGTGSGAAVLFATVTPGTALSASDFQVANTVPTP